MSLKLEHNQSLIDIALQEYGNADAVFDLIKANNLHLACSVPVGTELILPKSDNINKDIIQYFNSKSTKIATDTIPATEPVPCWILATGSWRDEGCWDDSAYWQDN